MVTDRKATVSSNINLAILLFHLLSSLSYLSKSLNPPPSELFFYQFGLSHHMSLLFIKNDVSHGDKNYSSIIVRDQR